MTYEKHYNTRTTPQSEKMPNTDQVENSAGGYAFAVDDKVRAERFLFLGSERGTYYINAPALTRENAEAAQRLVNDQNDGHWLVAKIVEVSQAGRAPKNSPALFLLAMATASPHLSVRKAAWLNLEKVARTGSHLFEFVRYREAFGGWGRLARQSVSRWYASKTEDELLYQVLKYRQREGWSHRDVLRLAHPVVPSELKPAMQFITRRMNAGRTAEQQGHYLGWPGPGDPPSVVAGFAALRSIPNNNVNEAISIIRSARLTREMVPTDMLAKPEIADVLMRQSPMGALVRNLGNYARLGLTDPLSDGERFIVEKLSDREAIRKARQHPLALFTAMKTYAQGHGMRGSKQWTPNPKIVDALNDATMMAFDNIEPTGKRYLLGVDVSSSMERPSTSEFVRCSEAAALMALAIARTEDNYYIHGFATNFIDLGITPKHSLTDAMRKVRDRNFGGTDCSLPMRYALKRKLGIDTFIVLTDNETWAGSQHPAQALREYREKVNPAAKLVVVGMASNGFSIADPNDAGMLDVVGLDTSVPTVIAEFSKR